MELTNALVKKQVKVVEDQYILFLDCPQVVEKVHPGQFVTLKVGNTFDPLLRRPFSIHSVNKDTGELLIYYQVVGKTTVLISQLKANDRVSILGPLGRGFDLNLENGRALLIGGGLGQAPLRFLAEELKKKNNQITTALGARDSHGLKNIVCFNDYCEEIRLSSEDGSIGSMGFVTDYLPDMIAALEPNIIYACGPLPMLSTIKTIAARGKIPCQISLETQMACGIGVCLGCTCESEKEDYYPKVCQHGPVFWAQEVKLNG